MNLCPTSPETGGNYVVPKSHLVYDELEVWKESLPAEQREEFYKLVAEQRPEIFREVINAHLEPGDTFLWTDMTLHQRCPGRGVGPTKPELIRAAVYVCMSPKSKATPEVLEERRKAVYCAAAHDPITRLALLFSHTVLLTRGRRACDRTDDAGNGHTAHHPMTVNSRNWPPAADSKNAYPIERLSQAQRRLVG